MSSEQKLSSDAGRAPSRKIVWRKTLYTLGITLGMGLLAYQTWQGALAFRQSQACVARPGYFALVISAYALAYLVQMAAWALIMRGLGAPLRAQAVLEGYTLAFLPRYIPGSVWGYWSRNEWLAQNHNVHYGLSTTASLQEAAMLVVTAMTAGALYWLPTLRQHPLLKPAIVAVGIFAVWLVWVALPWLAARLGKGGVLPTAQSVPQGIHILWLATTSTLLYLVFWMLQGAALVAITYTLCGGTTLPLFAATSAAAIAWAIGFLILFVPAGLGVREWTLSALLVTSAALAPGQATLLAIISRFGLVVAEILVLLLGLHTQMRHRWQQRRWNRRHWAADDNSL